MCGIHKTASIEFEFYELVYEFNMFLAWITESFKQAKHTHFNKR